MSRGPYPRAGQVQYGSSEPVPKTVSARLCLNPGVNAGALGLSDRDRASEHTDVTDVPGQRRMQQNRVESRRTLHNNDQLSWQLDGKRFGVNSP